jgi:leucyl aminopeptidase (aminopeptidase T)
MKEFGDRVLDFIAQTVGGTHQELEVHVTSDLGTNLRFQARPLTLWHRDYGTLWEPGSWGNLPAGEIFCAIVEGTAKGRWVVPKGWCRRVKPDFSSLEMTIAGGEITEIAGARENLGVLLGFEACSDDAACIALRRKVAEFGIGLNPKASPGGGIVEVVKIRGTCHIALGTNASFGGTIQADSHIDFGIPGPTIEINGTPLISNGIALFE